MTNIERDEGSISTNVRQDIDKQFERIFARTGKRPEELYLGPLAYYALRKEAAPYMMQNVLGSPAMSYNGMRIFILSVTSFTDEWHIKVA